MYSLPLGEMSNGMELISQTGHEMFQSAASAKSLTREGAQSITKVVDQMNKINHHVTTTTDVIPSLGLRSKEINDIVGFITQIAD
jgi:methyl-accepting chemotaxis protein